MTSNIRDRGPALETEDRLLLPAVLLLPWAFGGVEIWAFRGAALLLVAAAAVAFARRGADGLGLSAGRAGWLAPAGLLAAWAAFQMVPLPPAAIRVLSPATHEIYVEAFPSFAGGGSPDPVAAIESRALALVAEGATEPLPDGPDGSVALGSPDCFDRRWRSLSLEPSVTGERLAWYGALLLGFLTIGARVAERPRRKLYLGTIAGGCAALAVFALVQAWNWNGKIFWIREVSGGAQPFGPYVNPNHFAGVMELAVPILVALAWERVRQAGRDAVYEARFAGATLAAALCLAAGIATSSKMAALLIAAGLVFLGLFGARSARVRWLVVGATLILVALGATLVAGTKLGERVVSYVEGADSQYLLEGREAVWESSLAMFLDFPLTGSGFGTFREVFPRYTPPGAAARFAQAHNDYVEVLVEGGLVGFALLVWLIAAYGTRVVRRLRLLGSARRIVALGVLAGVGSLAIHALFDFNHQIPANALLFVAFCATLTPASQRGAGAES